MTERDFNTFIERDRVHMEQNTMVEELPENTEGDAWDAMLSAYRKLKAEKPVERSEKARRYAVLLTEYEKMMSYYLIMVSNDDFVG